MFLPLPSPKGSWYEHVDEAVLYFSLFLNNVIEKWIGILGKFVLILMKEIAQTKL